MKISELIEDLERLKNEHGDIRVVGINSEGDIDGDADYGVSFNVSFLDQLGF